jgi:hypothetical protein
MENGILNYKRFSILIFILTIITHGSFGIKELQSAILAKQEILDSSAFKEKLYATQQDVVRLVRETAKPELVEKIVGLAIEAFDIPQFIKTHDQEIIVSLQALIDEIYEMIHKDPWHAQLFDWRERFNGIIREMQTLYDHKLQGQAEDALIKFSAKYSYVAISMDLIEELKKSYFAQKLTQADTVITYLVEYINAPPQKRKTMQPPKVAMPTWLSQLQKNIRMAIKLLDTHHTDQQAPKKLSTLVQQKLYNEKILRALSDLFIQRLIQTGLTLTHKI